MNGFTIAALGDEALLVVLGDAIDAALNARVHAAAATLRATNLPGINDVTAAYASVCVRYDPAQWQMPDRAPFEALRARIDALLRAATIGLVAEQARAPIEIPVCYGGDYGADLGQVAAHAGLSQADVIAAHAGADYRVAMLGFAPGFAYLLGLDPRLHAPRRAQPRTRVPAGSVAIGGAQTGIYPRELPGGWQIIGRTPACLFDATRDAPALLAPGQRVRFRPISAAQFAAAPR
ncbi:MAG: 5-oxoprolinase subunit PxpB [Rudaea sp.]